MANYEGIIPLHGDHISRTFAVYISGRSIVTTVTQFRVAIRNWIHELRRTVRNGRVALYTKTVPRQNNNLPRVVMCCFFVNDSCLVAYLGNSEEIPMVISDFLMYPFTLVGVGGIRESVEALIEGLDEEEFEHDYPVTFDINSAAAESRKDPLLRDLDLPGLSSVVLGYAPVYPANMDPDWESLTDNQIAAITVDAAVIYALGEALAPPAPPPG